MSPTPPDPQALAIRRAARRFAQALAAEAMLDHTARVEARLTAGGSGSPFGLDDALTAAWPPSAGAPPRHEVIWARGDEADGLKLSAFDAAGRMLLRRTYAAAGVRRKREGARHD